MAFHVAFPKARQGQHVALVFSEFNILACMYPCRTLHPPPYEDRRMTRGQTGYALPCLYGSCIRYSLPVFTGAFPDTFDLFVLFATPNRADHRLDGFPIGGE